jgi:hypothetical protein
MRRTAIAATAALLLAVTGCSSGSEVTTEPDTKTAPGKTAGKAAPSEKPKNAKVGDSITIKGIEAGEQVQVTLKKIADPAKPADEFFSPEKGNRWIGAQYEILNTGAKVYADTPGNGSQVADTEGQRFGPVFADITAGPSMTNDATVQPGDKVLGWLVYEVPENAKLASIQFAMNSGFADQTGQWSLQ